MGTILIWPKCPVCPIAEDREAECHCTWIDVAFRRAAKQRLPLGVKASGRR